nr:hypothetical protein [Tanacetum cinerariifolium]
DILKKFGYSDVRSSNTPMDKENPWGKDGTRKDVDLHRYRSMIGSLMYITASKPDIMFVICACARHQVTPKESSPFDLVAYSDSDYGGASQDRKSTTGGSQFLGRREISVLSCTSKYWGILRILMIGLRLILLGEFNTDFHPMVDFIVASLLRCALTVKPTIFVSHIRQFWSTARIETTFKGTHILATVDGIQRTVFESSLKRNLKLRDEDEIISIPDTELFENLTLMGIVSLFDTMFIHQGEGSGTPTEPHHTPSAEADTSHPTTSSIPLSSLPTAPIPLALDNTQEEQGLLNQDRATIAKSSTLPHDSTPRVTSPTADEGSMQQTISELTALCTSLQRQHSELLAKFQAQEMEILRLKEKVQILEDREGAAAKQSGDDAPIKGRSINEGEAAAERISNDSEEIARILTSIDASTVLAGGIYVPTGSGSIPTAGPPAADISIGSEVAPTASLIVTACPIVTSYSKRKDKEVMVESDTLKKQKLQELIDAHKRDYYMAMIRNNLGWKVKDLKGMTFEEIESKFAEVWKQVEDFIPIGSKEETERLKRKGLNLKQEHIRTGQPLLSLPLCLMIQHQGLLPLAADEGSMQHTIFELMALCTSLQRQHSELLAKFQAQEVEILRLKERVQVLEDREGVAAK